MGPSERVVPVGEQRRSTHNVADAETEWASGSRYSEYRYLTGWSFRDPCQGSTSSASAYDWAC